MNLYQIKTVSKTNYNRLGSFLENGTYYYTMFGIYPTASEAVKGLIDKYSDMLIIDVQLIERVKDSK